MKAIQTILQALVCNLFPADMAYPLVSFFNMVIPLVGIILLRIALYMVIYTRIIFSFLISLHERRPLPPKEIWILK